MRVVQSTKTAFRRSTFPWIVMLCKSLQGFPVNEMRISQEKTQLLVE